MKDKVTRLGEHLIWNGRPFFRIDGRAITPAQLVFNHNYPELYKAGVPVFSSCGVRACVDPAHLHLSTLASRYRSSEEN